eukprot:3370121-Karenia_brevis.AAC.1
MHARQLRFHNKRVCQRCGALRAGQSRQCTLCGVCSPMRDACAGDVIVDRSNWQVRTGHSGRAGQIMAAEAGGGSQPTGQADNGTVTPATDGAGSREAVGIAIGAAGPGLSQPVLGRTGAGGEQPDDNSWNQVQTPLVEALIGTQRPSRAGSETPGTHGRRTWKIDSPQ